MVKNGAGLSVGFLFDDTLDSNDGVAQYVKTLGAWLSSQGYAVAYLVGETKLRQWAGGRVYSMSKNQKVVFNGNRLSIPLLASRKKIKQVLADNNFDVLHVQVPYSPFMAQLVINAASPKTAVVGTFHILPANKLAQAGSRVLRVLYGRSLARFDNIVSVSAPAAAFAKKAYGIDSTVLPNVVNIKRFATTKLRDLGDTPKIVFLGRLVERKGCKQLLYAFRLLYKQLPSAQLIIAGDGPQRKQLENYVDKYRLGDNVTFLGYINEKNKPGILSSADIACFPSLYGESFGIVLIEAMAAGAGVVIGGNNPGYASVLGDKPELLFDPSNTAALAARLQELLSNKKLVGLLHQWQQAEVKRYDVQAVGVPLIKIYSQAIAKRRNSRHN
ncbi:MAG: glycosyltransferase family 4 protein [Candidatus Saccharimonadales bacterium]|jgi:phosphatidylinositol alpha-mannosyltransferase